MTTDKMREPQHGERFLDTSTQHVVTYIGDHGHGPWWRDESDGHSFYCDWLDYYLWHRFTRLQ